MRRDDPLMRAGGRKTRGGVALTEFAISTMFLVPVLLYSAYLSDALYARLKIQEATAAATWDFTGRLLHDYGANGGSYGNHSALYGPAASSVQSKTEAAYQGLDPWGVAANNTHQSEWVGVGAKAKLNSVTCGNASGVTDPSEIANTLVPGGKLHTGGLVHCQAQGTVTNWLMGKAPVQGKELNVTVWPTSTLGSITVCGVGKASGGSCGTANGLTVFTDDWGLAEPGAEQNTSPDQNQNKAFYNVTKAVHDSHYPEWVGLAEATASTTYQIMPPVDPMIALDPDFGKHELTCDSYTKPQPVSVDSTSGSETSSPASDATYAQGYNWDHETGWQSQASNTWPYNNNDSASGFGPSGYQADTYKAAWGQRSPTVYLGKN